MFNRMPLKVTSDSQDHPHIPTCHFDNSSRASTHLLAHAVANLFFQFVAYIFPRYFFPIPSWFLAPSRTLCISNRHLMVGSPGSPRDQPAPKLML